MRIVLDLFDAGYYPSAATLTQLGQLDLTVVCAGVGMGKDSVIDASEIPRVVADTIREPRRNAVQFEIHGGDYFFRGYELDQVLADLSAGAYVQIGVGPC